LKVEQKHKGLQGKIQGASPLGFALSGIGTVLNGIAFSGIFVLAISGTFGLAFIKGGGGLAFFLGGG
jgi:hypothetical protein